MINIKKISVAELFSKFHVTLKEAWLNEVLEYLHVERAEADVSTVIQLVYEQWLYSELSNSTRPKIRLPPFEKKTSLDSDVVVQINWLIDIHTSMYSKLNEYVGRNTDNSFFQWELNDGTENLDSTNRMYLMEVTDGQRKMRAIEYQKIDKLCDKLSSGTKLLIYGGTICRRNVLLLTSNNVMILGGESEICQQNIPALVVARRLGIDEKKLKLIECVRNKGHENSVKTVKELETQGAEKVQITIPSVLMSENTAINSDAQQSKTMRISKTIKGEKVKEKKQKRPVLSRTITSYFRPQRKVSTSETSSKVIIKSQMPLVDQKIKEEPKSKYLLLDPLRKQEEVEPPSPLLPTIDSKQQSEYSTATTPPRESKKTSAEQSGSSVVSSRMLSTQKIINELGMQSELREITTKSIATMHCQSRNVQNLHASPQFRMQSENASLSAGLKNLETTRSLVVEEKNFILPPRKRDNTIILSGENERREIVTKPVIPIRTTELQRKSADAILHTAVISSSDIQESMIWTANKWQHTINEDSKQFLTNEFRVPTSEVQIQTVDNNNASSIDPSSIHGPLNSLQNCPPEEVNEIAVAQTSFNLQEEQVVGGKGSQIIQHVPHVAFQPNKTAFNSDILFPMSNRNLWRLPITSFQPSKRNPVPFHSSQYSFKNSEPQEIEEKSMYNNTSLKNRTTALILPDATIQVVPHVNIIQRYRALNIVSIREAYQQRKYCLVAHRKRVQPIFCKLHAGLQFIGQSWTAGLRIADETCDALDCLVDNNAISDLIGFTPQEAQQAAAISDRTRVTYYKGRAQAVLETFKRLDLVLTIEFSSSSDVLPLIVNITNLSTALGLC